MDNTHPVPHLPSPARKDRTFWRAQFEQWQISNLSKAAWCRREQLNVTAFYYWCRIFERDQAAGSNDHSHSTGASPSSFLPVALQHEPVAGFQLRVADVTLSCNQPVSPEQLQGWLQAIRHSQ
jgi:hypothetical protein